MPNYERLLWADGSTGVVDKRGKLYNTQAEYEQRPKFGQVTREKVQQKLKEGWEALGNQKPATVLGAQISPSGKQVQQALIGAGQGLAKVAESETMAGSALRTLGAIGEAKTKYIDKPLAKTFNTDPGWMGFTTDAVIDAVTGGAFGSTKAIDKIDDAGRFVKNLSINARNNTLTPSPVAVTADGLRIKARDVGNPNVMKIDQRLEGLLDDTTRVERGKWTIEDISRRQKINEAELNAWRRTEHGKSPNTYDRIRRGHQGTPTKQTELRAKEWAKNHSDPRIRERLVKMDAYESRITPVNYEKNLYPQWITQANVKGGNRKITKLKGLEYTVEQHHLIHLRDSATIGKYLDDLDSPITKAAVYEYMMKEYNILPGNFDLNIANIPTGPHRMTQGGDLHTWLDRLGYDDYWGDVAAEWTRLGKKPTATDILDAFDVYMDEVFNPMMVKLDDLIKKNPTKGEFKGAYTPEYLVEQAKNRLKHLQEPHRPQRLRGSQGGAEEAIEAQMEQAYKGGEGVPGSRWQETIDGLTIDSRKHFGKGPKEPKISKKELQIKRKQDRKRGIK